MPGLTLSQVAELELVQGSKFYPLLAGSEPDDRYEASGVAVRGEHLIVIFEDTPHVARIHRTLTPDHPDSRLFRQMTPIHGYVDISYDAQGKRFFLLGEARKDPVGNKQKPVINQFAYDFLYLDQDWVDFPEDGKDNQLGGLSYIRRDDQDYLLATCAGNLCLGGRKGKQPGGGRLLIFQNKGQIWALREKLELPKHVAFRNYVNVAIRGNRLAILSQETSALWICELSDSEWRFTSDGQVYRFPTNNSGEQAYCNLQGIDWMDDDHIVAVSGRRKGRQNRICGEKDQSVHLFRIPGQ